MTRPAGYRLPDAPISIHTPVKGVTYTVSRLSCVTSDFNPHTREGCDYRTICEYVRVPSISIHTPVKGVTPKACSGCSQRHHFNPHTREGCDLYRAGRRNCHGYFNPHTREGCDPLGKRDRGLVRQISIHTPVKGVTCITMWFESSKKISIHTPVKGVTCYDCGREFDCSISIHTPVKGVTTLPSSQYP